MAVNFTKNKDSMKKAWADIIDDNKLTKWAVFSYEGKSFDLQLCSTGDGDLQEMVDEFSGGKIMYAVCRVIDPKTSLPKFVLINWQGEGAPSDRKGKCANHIRDVGDFFKGAHITINARTEDDVDPNIILEKVSKSTGSAYSFKDRAGPLENHKPVGSVYKRIVPTAEINSKERDKFWEKQELEEKSRLDDERKKANQASSQLENERQKREIQDAHRRDEFVKQRTKIINEMRTAESVTTKNVVETEKKRWEKQVEEDAVENEKRLKNNEYKRLERNQEVESLIGQRTLNARAIFEQNTAAGQMSSMRNSIEKLPSSNGKSYSSQDSDSSSSLSLTSAKQLSPAQTPPSPEPEFATVCSNKVVSNVDTSHYAASRVVLGESPEPPKPARSLNIPEAERVSSPQDASQVFLSESEQEDVNRDNSDNELVAQYVYTNDGNLEQDNQPALIVRALYDYQAADETEISFNPDDIITHVDRIDEGWWQGLAPDGTYGLFPANYVEIIE